MSNLTANDVNGLMEAYDAVYNPDLREELEEEKEIKDLSFQLIEDTSHLLFSQGYGVQDVLDYFNDASSEIISEDYRSICDGSLIVESVSTSDEYIQEQFDYLGQLVLDICSESRDLDEGILDSAMKFAGRVLSKPARVEAGKRLAQSANPARTAKAYERLASQKLSKAGFAKPAAGAFKNTADAARAAAMAKPAGKLTSIAQGAKNFLGKAGGVLKGAAKLGGKALPVAGAALYGMDAADRFKKGDWGGGLLSTAGAVTSMVPGAGLVAGLAPAGIQMATDAMGLTGDKSRKGGAPKAPGKPPSLKAKQDYAASKGKYYSSSDQKTYGNYNDAVAARNSRRGVKPSSPTAAKPAPTAPTTSPAPSGRSGAPSTTTAAKPAPKAPSKPTSTATKDTPMQQWAKANPSLASKVKVGQSGYDEISQMRDKPGPNEKQDQTPTQGPNTTPKQDADFAKQAAQATAEFQKKEQEKLKQQQRQPVNASYEYDAFDLVLEYLTSEGHVDTLDEALYVMMEMDAETIQNICEAAADQSDKQIDKGVKTTYKAGNVLDNLHQGRSRGVDRLHPSKRSGKVERMRGRLKARRDDLFGERNRREDEKREKLKKLLGL